MSPAALTALQTIARAAREGAAHLSDDDAEPNAALASWFESLADDLGAYINVVQAGAE